MMHEHVITLRGAAASEAGLSGHLLRDLMNVLVVGAEQSLRYRLDGRSTARGTPPGWLRSASDFELIAMERGPGRRAFRVQARPLVDTMATRFAQADMFDDLDPKKSPLELFEDSLEQALSGNADSDAFDHALVETCAGFRTVLGEGVDSVEIMNGRLVRIDAESVERAARLAKESFASRRVRLAGHLNAIQYSDCRFSLVLEGGAKIAGTARDLGAEALREAFGSNVIITGKAEFRPSGKLLHIDAESVEPASEKDLKIFDQVPRPLTLAAPIERQVSKAGLAALLGKWPGDEPVEQLLEQLRQLS